MSFDSLIVGILMLGQGWIVLDALRTIKVTRLFFVLLLSTLAYGLMFWRRLSAAMLYFGLDFSRYFDLSDVDQVYLPLAVTTLLFIGERVKNSWIITYHKYKPLIQLLDSLNEGEIKSLKSKLVHERRKV